MHIRSNFLLGCNQVGVAGLSWIPLDQMWDPWNMGSLSMARAGTVECESGKGHHSSHNILQAPLPHPYSNRPRPLPTEGEVATTAARASAQLTGQLRMHVSACNRRTRELHPRRLPCTSEWKENSSSKRQFFFLTWHLKAKRN